MHLEQFLPDLIIYIAAAVHIAKLPMFLGRSSNIPKVFEPPIHPTFLGRSLNTPKVSEPQFFRRFWDVVQTPPKFLNSQFRPPSLKSVSVIITAFRNNPKMLHMRKSRQEKNHFPALRERTRRENRKRVFAIRNSGRILRLEKGYGGVD